MSQHTPRYSVFRHSSPFAIVQRIFSQVVRISPNAASTAVLPESREEIRARLSWFSMMKSLRSWRNCFRTPKEVWAQFFWAARPLKEKEGKKRVWVERKIE